MALMAEWICTKEWQKKRKEREKEKEKNIVNVNEIGNVK